MEYSVVNNQELLEKQNEDEGIALPDIKTYYKAVTIKMKCIQKWYCKSQERRGW